MQLSSPGFGERERIPARFTCDGEGVSPALRWQGTPQAAKSLALVCDDPDAPAGVWDHWILYNIRPEMTGLPEAVPPEAVFSDGSMHGLNSWGRLGYGALCPPSGTHRYYFKLYALDIRLELKAGARKADLLRAMDGHVLAEARLVGLYSR